MNDLDALLKEPNARRNPKRKSMIEDSVSTREAMISASGALATWTPPESDGA